MILPEIKQTTIYAIGHKSVIVKPTDLVLVKKDVFLEGQYSVHLTNVDGKSDMVLCTSKIKSKAIQFQTEFKELN